MKKNLVMFLFVALFSIATPTATVFAAETKETVNTTIKEDVIYDGVGIYQNCMPAVVHITYPGSGGSGFFVDKNIILTNYHVIAEIGSTEIDIVDMYDNHYTVKYVLGYNNNIDLALIEVNESCTTYLKRSTHKVLPGSLAYTLGNPYGIPFVIAQGLVGKPSWEIDGKNTIMHTAPMSSGNSGGPLVNQYGEVIGINTLSSGGSDAQNLNYAVQIAEMDKVDTSKHMTLEQFVRRNEQHVASISDAQVGDIVIIGKYEQDNNLINGSEDIEWVVADKKGNDLFLVSKYCLDVSCWNSNNSVITSWEGSEYESFFDAFYANSFSKKEKSIIKLTNINFAFSNEFDVSYNPSLYNKDSYSYVFLPSDSELSSMSKGEDFLLRTEATEYCKAKGCAIVDGYAFYATRSLSSIKSALETGNRYRTIPSNGARMLAGADGKIDAGYVALRAAMWIEQK